MLTDDIRRCMDRSVLCWLATTGTDGFPNVSPKEVFCAHGERTVLIANIASPGSARNIEAHPLVCVSFIDVFVQKGHKLKGRAELITAADTRYAQCAPALERRLQGLFQLRSIIAVEVMATEPIIAPSYRFVLGTTEAAQIAAAMRAYGVMPRTTSPD